jgi:hypothetical protein
VIPMFYSGVHFLPLLFGDWIGTRRVSFTDLNAGSCVQQTGEWAGVEVEADVQWAARLRFGHSDRGRAERAS